MNNPIFRIAMAMLVCSGMTGCATGVTTTSLQEVSVQQGETRLLKSVGYVVHGASQEQKSWIDALSGFTDMGNIFIEEKNGPVGMLHSFSDYAKIHPVVHIYLEEVRDNQWMTKVDYAIYVAPTVLSFMTFGATPAYYPEPHRAFFKLSRPGDGSAPPSHWEYSYDRRQFLWLPLFLFADFSYSINGGGELDTRWKVEEKRRLLLKFLKGAEPLLGES